MMWIHADSVSTRMLWSTLEHDYINPEWVPPSRFNEWVGVSEAIIEGHVTGVYPGFGGMGNPSSLITVSVAGNLYPAEKPIPSVLQIVIPVAEFVIGDVIFCGYKSWGGYYPRKGDVLLIGAFAPPEGDAGSFLDLVVPSQVFVLGDYGSLERLRRTNMHGDPVPFDESERSEVSGFPDTLMEFYDSVNELWANGVTSSPSLHDRNTQNR